MRKIIIGFTLLFFILSAGAASAQQAREYYKCTSLSTYEKLSEAIKIYRKAMNEAGYADYEFELLYPLYSTDTKSNVVYWQGTAPNMQRLGAANDWFWFSDEASTSRGVFEKTLACQSAEMVFVVKP